MGANNRLLFIKIGYCFPYCFLEIFVSGQNQQGGHKPEKHGKLREFEKLSESQGKLREISIFLEKPGKLRGKCKNMWHNCK